MITREAIEHLLDGLTSAIEIITKELDELRSERDEWQEGSQIRRDLNCEIAGIRRVAREIEKQINVLKEKDDSRGSRISTTNILSQEKPIHKRLEEINDFLEQYTVHDDDDYSNRIIRIVYNEHGKEDLVAKWDFIPGAER